MASWWRRRRFRSASYYFLIAFCVSNCLLALLFFRRLYIDDGSSLLRNQSGSSGNEDFADGKAPFPPPKRWDISSVTDGRMGAKAEENEEDGGGDGDVPPHDKQAATTASSIEITADDHDPAGENDGERHHTASAPSLSTAGPIRFRDLYFQRSRRPTFLNMNSTGFSWDNIDVVVVVQVHDRGSYLAYLLDSFKHVPNWEKTLVVFSHDYYSPEIDQLVLNCTFAPIVDIYFPVSQQFYTDRFPGEDPRDCPRDSNVDHAKSIGCRNANYPDTYGHYREVKYTQTKHHWIWKMHYVFDFLMAKNAPKFSGYVMLLEEDHYVAPDFLHLLREAISIAGQNRIITVGNYRDSAFGSASREFAVNKWVSSRLNMGMSMTPATWKLIQGCIKVFCDRDDYNWDWSLQFTAMNCIDGNLMTLYARSSRVFHIGECAGIHFKNKCVATEKVASVKQLIEEHRGDLFPKSVSDSSAQTISQLKPKANGGWGDPRDRNLCRTLATAASYDDIMRMVERLQTEPL